MNAITDFATAKSLLNTVPRYDGKGLGTLLLTIIGVEPDVGVVAGRGEALSTKKPGKIAGQVV
jgi:hypothetical protein